MDNLKERTKKFMDELGVPATVFAKKGWCFGNCLSSVDEERFEIIKINRTKDFRIFIKI